MTTYAELDARLTGRCATRRKVANNTWAERRDDMIAIRLHSTDVATFAPDGTITLDSGGWLTATTKDRIHDALPGGWRVWQERGRWYVSGNGHTYAYADGMTVNPDTGLVTGYLPESEQESQDRVNRKTRASIRRFVAGITASDIMQQWENSAGDCLLCRFGQTGCLESHVFESYFHATLARNAIASAGYPSPDVIMAMVYASAERGQVDSLLTRALSKYLRKNLVTGVSTR